MDALGGGRIKDCKRVLIKPNLLATAKPDDAVVTRFMLVKTVAEYVLEKGAIPQVALNLRFCRTHFYITIGTLSP